MAAVTRRCAAPALRVVLALAGTAACSDTAAEPEPVIAITAVPATTGQEALAGTSLPQPLAVSVTVDGVPAAGIDVTWSASAGTLGRAASRTDAAGRATTAWKLGAEPGVQTAMAAVVGAAPVSFSATALPPVTTPVPVVTSIGIEQGGTIHVSLGLPRQLTAQAHYDDGSVREAPSPQWSVADHAVATISSDGLLTPVGMGSTTVTLASAGHAASATAIVVGPVATLEVVAVPDTVFVGQSVRWSLRAYDANGITLDDPTSALWTSSAPHVAFTRSDGTTLGLSPGTATITATVDGVSGSAKLVVTALPDLTGIWRMSEVWETDTWPPQECRISGPVDLEHATATGLLTGTYEMVGDCPNPHGGDIDMSGTVSLTGASAGAEVAFETVPSVRCRYVGTVSQVPHEIRGSVSCRGLPGTADESVVYEGGFLMWREG